MSFVWNETSLVIKSNRWTRPQHSSQTWVVGDHTAEEKERIIKKYAPKLHALIRKKVSWFR